MYFSEWNFFFFLQVPGWPENCKKARAQAWLWPCSSLHSPQLKPDVPCLPERQAKLGGKPRASPSLLSTCNNTDACQRKQGYMQGLCQTQECLLSLLRANYSDHTLPTTAPFEKHPHTVLLWIVFSLSRSAARNSPIFHAFKVFFFCKEKALPPIL